MWYIIIAIILLSSTLVLGSEINGSENWIKFGNYSIQPSEFAKLFLILYLASSLKKVKNMFSLIKVGIPVFICISILVVEKDLGAALIYFGIFMAMLFVETSSAVYTITGLITFH